MNAHPMLQPTDWTVDPDRMRANVSGERSQVYALVWNSALACTLRSPTILHARYYYYGSKLQQAFAVARVTIDPNAPGYWRYASDYPQMRFPVVREEPLGVYATVSKVYARASLSLTMGRFIETLSQMGIGGAATTASMLQDVCGARVDGEINARYALLSFAPMQSYRGDNVSKVNVSKVLASAADTVPITVQLTVLGQTKLQDWRAKGLIGQAAIVNHWVDAVSSGASGFRESLDALALSVAQVSAAPGGVSASSPFAEDAANYIDSMCKRWAGISRDEAASAASLRQITAPHHPGLPHWMDPQNLLAPEHPWRDVKKTMEQELYTAHATWLTLDNAAKSVKRVQWLTDHRKLLEGMDIDVYAHLIGSDAKFSALRHWFVGG